MFVGAGVPFGAVQVGPNNIFKGWDWCSGYHYEDSILIGFSQLHLNGTGIGDLGDVLIMPYTGPVRTDKGTQAHPESGYASHFSHASEAVRPGYYAVTLADYNIDVELTASERTGFHRYYFPPGKEAHVIIDLKEGSGDQAMDTHIELADSVTLKGYRFSKGWAKDQRVYFAIRSATPIRNFRVFDDSVRLEGTQGSGKAIKGLISWDNNPSLLQLKVGISPVSPDNALANIDAEIPGWDFNEVVRQADEKWNAELSKIKVETRNAEDKKIFYTALYHTMIDPTLFNDHNGDYRGTDKKLYTGAPFSELYGLFPYGTLIAR